MYLHYIKHLWNKTCITENSECGSFFLAGFINFGDSDTYHTVTSCSRPIYIDFGEMTHTTQ